MAWNADPYVRKFARFADHFNQEAGTALCRQLIRELRKSKSLIPKAKAEEILGTLRRKRCFDLLQKVAEALIQSGQDTPRIRRQYAQALLEQGHLSAALCVLQQLIPATLDDPRENAEAWGLVGRVGKQIYVEADNPSLKRHQEFLRRSLRAYYEVYAKDASKIWHGINLVALLCRARRDGVNTGNFPNPETLAARILESIERKPARKRDAWDFATAAEACLALKKHDESLRWLNLYVADKAADAFELASTLRQFTQVWQLDANRGPGARLLLVLLPALLRRKAFRLDLDKNTVKPRTVQSCRDDRNFTIAAGPDCFRSLDWLALAMDRANAVVRVETPSGRGQGTGFLLRGGDLHSRWGDEILMLTNAHVLYDREEDRHAHAIGSDQARIRYRAHTDHSKVFTIKKVLWRSPYFRLDAILVRLNNPVPGVNPYPLVSRLPQAGQNEQVYIIGHPGGGQLAVSLRDNRFLAAAGFRVHYRTPAEDGSSGSPVFDQGWNLIALHHAASNHMKKLDKSGETYPASEGIWIQSIIQAIRKSRFPVL